MQGDPMTMVASYNAVWVVVSILIAVAAVLTTLEIANRQHHSKSSQRSHWLLAGGLALGFGIWAMNFTAMLALDLPLAVHFDIGLTVASLAVAVTSGMSALLLVARPGRSMTRVVGGGVAFGLAVAATHFIGMAALRISAMPTYSPALVALSIVVAIAAALGTLWLATCDEWGHGQRLSGALAMGLALAGTHYTAMAAVSFTPTNVGLAPLTATFNVAEVDGALVGISTLFVIAIGLLAAFKEYHQRTLAKSQAAWAADLAAANRQLLEADRHKDEFLQVISHELRTPLNFIMGFASILEDEVQGTLNVRQKLYVERILGGSDRMLRLVNDLLDLAKIQAGKFSLSPAPVYYESVVEEAIASLAPLAARKNIVLTGEILVGSLIEIDGPRVIQVLINLIGNAIKFTPAGGRVTVKAFVQDGGQDVITQVTDTGVGIAAEDISKLFGRFHQLDMSKTREAGGSGLGLSICKAMIEAHGGQVGVLSEPGVGSTFWFTLPGVLREAPPALPVQPLSNTAV